MKVFIGSSSEAKQEMRNIARWLEEERHQALLWDEPGVFVPGEHLFTKLRGSQVLSLDEFRVHCQALKP
jgi:hypothetical protein